MLSHKDVQKQSPIFVVGSARSGTSIISRAIKEGAQIKGYAEGHFLPMIIPIMKAINDYYSRNEELTTKKSRTISNIDRTELEYKILEVFKSLYQSLIPDNCWIDKTPGVETIKALPYIQHIWLESRIIFAKRRGIENVISRLKKFPHVSFESSCMRWKMCMEAWLATKKKLDNTLYVEIEQRQIALQPEQMAKEIGDFLGLNPNQINGIAEFFITQRPQSTGSIETEEAVDISEVGWSEEQVNFFRENCGSISQKFGYSETSSYFLT